MRDIFTLENLDNPGREHVLPAVLGGKFVSRRLIQATTNGTIGSVLEPCLVDTFRLFLNVLGMTNRRGKTVGYNLVPETDANYLFGSKLRPELRRAELSEGIIDGKREIRITARNMEEAKQFLLAAKRKCPRLDIRTLQVASKKSYPKEPLNQNIAIGGPDFFRVVAKSAFEGLALSVGNDVACSVGFDDFRLWFLNGIDAVRRGQVNQDDKDLHVCNHDYRESVWSGLPALPEAPFQHRVFAISDPGCGGAYGLVELFGAFRFSTLLSNSNVLPIGSFGYLVDPQSGREERNVVFRSRVFVSDIGKHEADLSKFRDAVRNSTEQLLRHQQNDILHRQIDEAMKRCLPADGEPLTSSAIAKLSAAITDEFVSNYLRLDSEEPLDSAALARLLEDEDAG